MRVPSGFCCLSQFLFLYFWFVLFTFILYFLWFVLFAFIPFFWFVLFAFILYWREEPFRIVFLLLLSRKILEGGQFLISTLNRTRTGALCHIMIIVTWVSKVWDHNWWSIFQSDGMVNVIADFDDFSKVWDHTWSFIILKSVSYMILKSVRRHTVHGSISVRLPRIR